MARNKSFNLAEDIRFKNMNKTEAAGEAPAQPAPSGYVMLNAEDIQPSPYNEGLSIENIESYVSSMKESGLIEPIAVYDLGNGKYEILSGHQRYEAWCKILGNKTIKAVVRPYEKDPLKRFRAHTEANVLTRNKDLRFWLSRIEHARRVLKETGFSGTKAEEYEKISELVNGLSPAQLYRYEGFKKLIPELQDFESKRCMSASTLYQAVSLDAAQQAEVAKRVRALQGTKAEDGQGVTDVIEITREEFSRIVTDVRKGKKQEPARPRKKSTYSERLDKLYANFLKGISRSRTQAERKEALEYIAKLRLQLDELEKELS